MAGVGGPFAASGARGLVAMALDQGLSTPRRRERPDDVDRP